METRDEIEAWLGDNHGLDDDQVAGLLAISREIDVRYPDPDESDLRDAAMTAACRFMVEPADAVLADLAADLLAARQVEAVALAALRQGALQIVPRKTTRMARGIRTRSGYADAAGIHRSAVRDWFGER